MAIQSDEFVKPLLGCRLDRECEASEAMVQLGLQQIHHKLWIRLSEWLFHQQLADIQVSLIAPFEMRLRYGHFHKARSGGIGSRLTTLMEFLTET